MRDKAALRSGMQVLVNGASGGVGTFAVQIARALGEEVTGVCRSDAAELVRELGASRTVDFEREDFADGSALYDVVFDVVANRSYAECRDALTASGVYVTTRPGPQMVMDKARALFADQRAEFVVVSPNGSDLRTLARMIEAGEVRPVIDRVFPLEHAGEAQRHLEQGHPRGKIVLCLAGDG